MDRSPRYSGSVGRVTKRAPAARYEVTDGDHPRVVRRPDTLAVEEPMEIRIDGEPLTVTMRTPGDDFDLTLGFLHGEGLIADADDVARLMHCLDTDDDGSPTYNVVDVTLREAVHEPGDVVRVRDEALAVEEPQRQVEVVAERPHSHPERFAVDPDLHRFLDRQGVRASHHARLVAVGDLVPCGWSALRHPSHRPPLYARRTGPRTVHPSPGPGVTHYR